jgi:hypothetical protein
LPHGGAEFSLRLPCLPTSVGRMLNGHLVNSV